MADRVARFLARLCSRNETHAVAALMVDRVARFLTRLHKASIPAVGRSAMRWSCLHFNVLLLPESYRRLSSETRGKPLSPSPYSKVCNTI